MLTWWRHGCSTCRQQCSPVRPHLTAQCRHIMEVTRYSSTLPTWRRNPVDGTLYFTTCRLHVGNVLLYRVRPRRVGNMRSDADVHECVLAGTPCRHEWHVCLAGEWKVLAWHTVTVPSDADVHMYVAVRAAIMLSSCGHVSIWVSMSFEILKKLIFIIFISYCVLVR